jgi:hypothetical protein
MTNLLAKYSNLISNVNLFGDYGSALKNSGDMVTLLDQNRVLIDQVRYSDGGRWGKWSDGGGSSLELIDPYSHHRLADNWADSDESGKATNWFQISQTNYLDNGAGGVPADFIEITLGGGGECLIDDVEVIQNGTNVVSNQNLNSGTNGWIMRGNHAQSFCQTSGGYSNSGCLHLKASGGGDAQANRVIGFFNKGWWLRARQRDRIE